MACASSKPSSSIVDVFIDWIDTAICFITVRVVNSTLAPSPPPPPFSQSSQPHMTVSLYRLAKVWSVVAQAFYREQTMQFNAIYTRSGYSRPSDELRMQQASQQEQQKQNTHIQLQKKYLRCSSLSPAALWIIHSLQAHLQLSIMFRFAHLTSHRDHVRLTKCAGKTPFNSTARACPQRPARLHCPFNLELKPVFFAGQLRWWQRAHGAASCAAPDTSLRHQSAVCSKDC